MRSQTDILKAARRINYEVARGMSGRTTMLDVLEALAGLASMALLLFCVWFFGSMPR
jgi:hypothetical protein